MKTVTGFTIILLVLSVNLVAEESLLIKTLKGHTGCVRSVNFSPDGEYLASGSLDNTIKLWRISWKEIERRETKKKLILSFITTGILFGMVIFTIRQKIRANLRTSLPEMIREAISSGKHEQIWDLYMKYISAGGETRKFQPDELFTIYDKSDQLNKLVQEVLPKEYFFTFTKKLVTNRNYEYAYKMYEKYKKLGGETEKNFTTDELTDIYLNVGKLDELKNEYDSVNMKIKFANRLYLLGRLKESLSMVDDKEIILLSALSPEDFELVCEIYFKNGKFNEVVDFVTRKYVELRNPVFYKLIVNKLMQKEDYETVLRIIRIMIKRYPDSITDDIYEHLVYTSEKLNCLGEILPDTLPEKYWDKFLMLLKTKNMDKEVEKFVSKISKRNLKDLTYYFSICLKYELYELLINYIRDTDFKKLNSSDDERKILELFYQTGVKLEDAGKNELACEIYEKFVNEIGLYKDVNSRYLRLFAITAKVVVPSQRTLGKETVVGTQTSEIYYIGSRYEIVREIGRGGMGVVYEAVNKEINKRVAIKKMREELATRVREKDRFLEEARCVAKLHHPNIVDIYDMFEEGGNVYLVFEYIDGETVEEMLNKRGRLRFDDVLRIIISVCEALKYAHSLNIIHRDIKPSNIIVSKDGWVKVMDFGIARELKDTLSRLTGKDTSGTLAYMSPEQHSDISDVRSDIYSLGCTIYEMLTGELPFKGPDFLAQKKGMVYTPATELVPELPKQVDEIISKCLQADKEKRYHTVDELIMELEKIQV